jgi:hypothetical protein
VLVETYIVACELRQANVQLTLQRAASATASAHCTLFRLPAGVSDKTQYDEVKNNLPAGVADRSSYRDRHRHSRSARTSRFSRRARPPTYE